MYNIQLKIRLQIIERLVHVKDFFKKDKKNINQLQKKEQIDLIACLLIEVAKSDDSFDESELIKIKDILRRNKAYSDDKQIDDIIDKALDDTSNSVEMYSLTKEIRDTFDHEQILELFQFMWEIILVDNEIDDFETGLIRKSFWSFSYNWKRIIIS